MKSSRIILLLFISLIACETPEYEQIETTLLRDSWSITKTVKSIFNEDEFVRNETTEYAPKREYFFEKGGAFSCVDPDLTEIITGTWSLDSAGRQLSTSLVCNPNNGGCSRDSYYFYPLSNIVEFGRNSILLETEYWESPPIFVEVQVTLTRN